MAQPRFSDLSQSLQLFVADVEDNELVYANRYNHINDRTKAREKLDVARVRIEHMLKNKTVCADYTEDDWTYLSLTRDALLLDVFSDNATRIWRETLARAEQGTDYHSLAVAQGRRRRVEKEIRAPLPPPHLDRPRE